MRLALLAALVLGSPPPVPAAAPAERYGRMPEAVVPYRRHGAPYARFFEIPQAFLGPREPPLDPRAAGLRSVKIGLLGPLLGPEAALGRAMERGARLALEQANARGGVGGVPYELVSRNDAGAWGASSNEMAALAYDDRVWAVLGSIDGAATHVALRVALKAEVPMVTTGCTDPTVTETAIPWIVRPASDDRQHGYLLAQHIFGTLGLREVAVLRSSQRYGRLGVAELRDAARRLGRPLALELLFEPGGALDPLLRRIAEAQVQGLVIWANAAEGARIVRALRASGATLPVFGGSRLVSPRFLQAGAAAEGVVAAASFDPTRPSERWQAFQAAFRERFGEAPDSFAAHAYDGSGMIVAAIEQAGLSRGGIRDALAARREIEGVTGSIRLDATHNDVGPVFLARVRGGRFHFSAAR